jgi:hypothetical protein
MAERFDEEFYKSPWHHVLPVGPYGIQPYVRKSRTSGLPAVLPRRRRLIATLGGAARAVSAFRRLAALAIARLLPEAPPRRQRRSPRLAHQAACPACEPVAPRPLSKAA